MFKCRSAGLLLLLHSVRDSVGKTQTCFLSFIGVLGNFINVMSVALRASWWQYFPWISGKGLRDSLTVPAARACKPLPTKAQQSLYMI